ncbi:basic leucine zipper transcriptional factor ATF-like 2 isoform X1 [Pteropus alecto]|uniref:Basic leucine zipper transcriptional factor ATF-like 2 n=2 Tax=Pteropus alecto TaxID=9402 RepID=L5KPZ8_PTEAL|nr:basic leucine zipper transcriptional factor ATF-like 2 isoform X1 [Pteropus alecto]ELK13372.1 Basic leucine zipper transcriptional factor ATF-like 2 [Pteropus alecto]
MHLSGGEGLLAGTDTKVHERQLKKKEKNRASAQRSRQKHTDKADALHQQHELLEKHNHALRKEIEDLRAELAWWSQTLHMHERLCLMDYASCLAPLPSGCWGQAGQPLEPLPHGQQGCQEQPGLSKTPVSMPSAQQLSSDPQPHDSTGLLLSPLCSLSLGPTAATVLPAQLSPSLVQSALPSGSRLLRLTPSSKLNALLPNPSAQPSPSQPLGSEHPTREKLASSPHSLSAALELTDLQDREHKPAFSVADLQGLGVDLSSHPPLASPLLSVRLLTQPTGAGLAPSLGSGSSLITQASPPLPQEAALLG